MLQLNTRFSKPIPKLNVVALWEPRRPSTGEAPVRFPVGAMQSLLFLLNSGPAKTLKLPCNMNAVSALGKTGIEGSQVQD